MSLLILIVALPALAAALGFGAGAKHSASAAVLARWASAIAFLLASALAVQVLASGPVSVAIAGHGGDQLLVLYANRIVVVLLLLVCGISALVQSYAGRYLQGDLRTGRFFAAASLLTAATAAMVSAGSIVGLGVAWSTAGAALCLLLNMYSGLPAAAQGLRRTVTAFMIGDAAIWSGILIALLTWGNLNLRDLPEQVPRLMADPTAVNLCSCLIVVAAMARSAQLPLHRWLAATLAAPTPVSALLHAGVVNGGGVLLVRLSALVGISGPAMVLAFGVGGATAVYGTLLMLTKPDVKGSLTHSTLAQMGFMTMTCGLGAFAAAIFHLVAHGIYKASLFLGSGSAVHSHVRHLKAPPAPAQGGRDAIVGALLAAAAGAGAVLSALALINPQTSGDHGTGGLLVFAWATASAAIWAVMRRRLGALLLGAGVILVYAMTWAYVGWLKAFTAFVSADLGAAGQTHLPGWLLLPVIVALAALACIKLAPQRLAAVHDWLYVLALSAGHVVAEQVGSGRERPRLLRAPSGFLQPESGTAA